MTENIELPDTVKPRYQEPKFFGAMLADILRIKEILDPVLPTELGVWQTYFRHYKYPGKEIRVWLSFAEAYSEKSKGKTPDEQKHIFLTMLSNREAFST